MERIHISLLIYLVLGVIPAIIASQKGRSAVGWYLYGFLAFPIAFIHSILAIEVHRAPCPHCSEKIPTSSAVCPDCQRDLPNATVWKTIADLELFGESDFPVLVLKTGAPLQLEANVRTITVLSIDSTVGRLSETDSAMFLPLLADHECAAFLQDVVGSRVRIRVDIHERDWRRANEPREGEAVS